MKKNILGIVFVAFALVAGYNVYCSQKPAEMSDMALANVEALAGSEGSGGSTIYCCGNYGTCMKVMDSQGQVHDVAGIKFSTPCPE